METQLLLNDLYKNASVHDPAIWGVIDDEEPEMGKEQ